MNVGVGLHDLQVQRFGYRDLKLTVRVTESPEPMDLRMDVDPVALQGLTVTGGGRAAVTGVVLDAGSGRPVAWADLALTRNIVRDDRRASADQQGVFSMDDVASGAYLLRVERIGYQGQYVPVSHALPPEPLEIRLEPDSAAMRGLAVMTGEIALRSAGHGRESRGFDERSLRESPFSGMREFIEYIVNLPRQRCGSEDVCVLYRGRVVKPVLYIDELPTIDLLFLDSYRPQDIYRLDVFDCPGSGESFVARATVVVEIRAYTYEYMARMSHSPRIMQRPCLP